MNYLNQIRTLSAGCACLAMSVVIGCGNSVDQADRTDVLPVDDVEIPTQEEADAQAAAEITSENADEAFRELEREILGDEP